MGRPVNAVEQPLLPSRRYTLGDYLQAGGYQAAGATQTDKGRLVDILGNTSLTGLGGANFPFASKFLATSEQGRPSVVVCNAAEDEPGSRKDRTLLERNPHVVLEGTLLAASALGADEIFVYVSEELERALASLRQAVADIEGLPLVEGVTIRVVAAPSAYVAGEATAVIEAIDGKPALPRKQPPYPTAHGVSGRPTLLSNCETFANLPRLVMGHLENHLHLGDATHTRLVTVDGDVNTPGVYEVFPRSTTLRGVIETAGGVLHGAEFKAVQPGGPSSAYLAHEALNTRLEVAEIRAAGSQAGCLAIRVLSSLRCIVEDLCEVTAFFAREQCGQCPSCRMKTGMYHKTVRQVRDGKGNWRMLDQFGAIDEYVSDMPSICALISMPSPPVESALRLFRSDFAHHIDGGCCPLVGSPSSSELETSTARPRPN